MNPTTVLLKLGGNALNDEAVLTRFADQVMLLRKRGVRVVVTHGAGPQIDEELTRARVPTQRVDGHRVTSPEAMVVIREVMVGQMQKHLVDVINAASSSAGMPKLSVGFSPEHTQLFRCVKKPGVVDYQCVGDIVSLDATAVVDALDRRYVPVVSGIGVGVDDRHLLFNINADTAAAALAGSLKIDHFVLISNVPGVYRDFERREGFVDSMTVTDARNLLPELRGGMLPKVQACIDALDAGAGSALMMSADDLRMLDEVVFGQARLGTRVLNCSYQLS